MQKKQNIFYSAFFILEMLRIRPPASADGYNL